MLIRNAYCYDPYRNKESVTDILIKGTTIKAVGQGLDADGEEVIDATGLFLCPGFTDVHSHFRDPGFTHKEDIITGSRAAARGGYTHIVLMANTNPATDNTDTLKYVLEKGRTTGIHIDSCASISKGLKGVEHTDMEILSRAGAVGFTDDGIPLMDEEFLKEAFKKAAALNKPISLHEENKALIHENGLNHGKASDKLGLYGSENIAEYSLIERDIPIAIKAGCKLDIQHISTKEGVELVRKARKQSDLIFAEVTPHHFSLTEEAVLEHGTLAKMNPPLRTDEDRKAILDGIKDGTISIIATDHAPHTTYEKEKPFTEAPSGIIGLETAFSLGVKNLVNTGLITMMELIRMLTVNPEKLYGFKEHPLEEGYEANFVLFDKEENWKYEESVSKSSNSPFLMQTLPCKIKMTICDGKVVYND